MFVQIKIMIYFLYFNYLRNILLVVEKEDEWKTHFQGDPGDFVQYMGEGHGSQLPYKIDTI